MALEFVETQGGEGKLDCERRKVWLPSGARVRQVIVGNGDGRALWWDW